MKSQRPKLERGMALASEAAQNRWAFLLPSLAHCFYLFLLLPCLSPRLSLSLSFHLSLFHFPPLSPYSFQTFLPPDLSLLLPFLSSFLPSLPGSEKLARLGGACSQSRVVSGPLVYLRFTYLQKIYTPKSPNAAGKWFLIQLHKY